MSLCLLAPFYTIRIDDFSRNLLPLHFLPKMPAHTEHAEISVRNDRTPLVAVGGGSGLGHGLGRSDGSGPAVIAIADGSHVFVRVAGAPSDVAPGRVGDDRCGGGIEGNGSSAAVGGGNSSSVVGAGATNNLPPRVTRATRLVRIARKWATGRGVSVAQPPSLDGGGGGGGCAVDAVDGDPKGDSDGGRGTSSGGRYGAEGDTPHVAGMAVCAVGLVGCVCSDLTTTILCHRDVATQYVWPSPVCFCSLF